MAFTVHIIFLFSLLIQCFNADAVAAVPMVELKNAAVKGTKMPAMGLGMGGYGTNKRFGYGGYPECWMEVAGCGDFTKRAIGEWLK